MVNDVSALSDPDMSSVVADAGVPVVLMHMSALPREMQQHTAYDDIIADIRRFLETRIAAAFASGISPHNIIIDPGIGFGKTYQHNIDLLRKQRSFTDLGYPLLIGVSRKAVIGIMTGRPAPERVVGSAVVAAFAVQAGASIIRVHDVAATVDAVKVAVALRSREAK